MDFCLYDISVYGTITICKVAREVVTICNHLSTTA